MTAEDAETPSVTTGFDRRSFLTVALGVSAGASGCLESMDEGRGDEAGEVEAGDVEHWLEFGFDERNTSHQEGGDVLSSPRREWVFEAGDAVFATPIFTSDSIYVGSFDGRMQRLDRETGTETWSFEVDEPEGSVGFQSVNVESTAQLVDGRLYFGSWNGYIYCLDAESGDVIWRYAVPSIVRSSPAVVEGSVYFGDWRGVFHRLDGEEGRLVWSLDTGDSIHPTPCFDEAHVYFGGSDFAEPGRGHEVVGGSFHAVDQGSGEVEWRTEFDGAVVSSPVLSDDMVLFGTTEGRVYSLDTTSGERVWSHSTDGMVTGSPALGGGKLYIGDHGGTLYALDVSTGEAEWSYGMSEEFEGRWGGFYGTHVSVGEELVYVGGQDGSMKAIDAGSGGLNWSYDAGAKVRSGPSIADGVLYFGDTSGNVHALSDEGR